MLRQSRFPRQTIACWAGAMVLGALAAAPGARAQCPVIDFEDQPVGTAITNQYPGVTFQVLGQSCGGPTGTPLFMRIANSPQGTSSGSRMLKIDAGCPSFSPDRLAMVFDLPQQRISFTLGDWATTYVIRAYDVPAGGTALGTWTIPIAGSGSVGVHRAVTIAWLLPVIRRLEIEALNSNFEAIDDLRLTPDTTPPTARIDTPVGGACVCGIVAVNGVACDDDGTYGFDRLEFRAMDAPAGAPWTLVGSFVTPVCTSGSLYAWNTAGLVEGFYILRLTAQNACGLATTDEAVVYVDQAFSLTGADINRPPNNSIIGGNYCIEGTVDDECFTSYTVMYRSASGGSFSPVDPPNSPYTEPRVNQVLARWNTASGAAAVADGDYQVRVRATDDCGHIATVVRNVTVDNTPPTAVITSPGACSSRCGAVTVRGTVSDAHMKSWVLEFTGGDHHDWVVIANGTGNVVDGTLGLWNTANLRPCAYTLRLRAEDAAALDCCGTDPGNTAEYTLSLNVGAYADCNGDGVLNLADFGCFQTRFALGCP